jgi:IS6 family transposase
MSMRGSSSAPAGYRFPQKVIAVAVRWYLRYGLSYRDVEELLAERGVTVDHVTVYRWVQRFTPEFIVAARHCRHVPGARWFVDETYVKVAGRWCYVHRAIDQHGQVVDVLLSVKRDLGAARAFSSRRSGQARCRSRSPPIGPRATRVFWTSCCRQRCTRLRGTRITRSRRPLN